jgi:hypothetical protein
VEASMLEFRFQKNFSELSKAQLSGKATSSAKEISGSLHWLPHLLNYQKL